TASGGAWNASIVAEYFHFQGRIVSTAGLGSTISSASDSGRFDVLLAATLIMATVVVLINRLLWRRLYRLASSRLKLEAEYNQMIASLSGFLNSHATFH